jgi:hypothetical protein
LPIDCITDPDIGDVLTFVLSTENNSALPYWLNFDPKTFVISGNPPIGTEESFNLKLTATDKGKLKEWIVFKLVVSIPTVVNDKKDNQIFRCFPNPFLNRIVIQYKLPADIHVTFTVTNLMGAEIARIVDVKQAAGYYEYVFEPKNLVTGIYFFTMKTSTKVEMQKVLHFEQKR